MLKYLWEKKNLLEQETKRVKFKYLIIINLNLKIIMMLNIFLDLLRHGLMEYASYHLI